MTQRYTDTTTPAVTRFDYDSPERGYGEPQWKVSPYGPLQPDQGAIWCDTEEEAQAIAAEQVDRRARLDAIARHARREALRAYLAERE